MNSVRNETQASGVFQKVPYNLTCLPVLCNLFYQNAAQSLRFVLTSLFEMGSSLTAYNFRVGACNIFFTAPESKI